ncbi:hypothetical protein CISIN_1g047098mg [Citrus sinensis]|uniref:Uncharacterized protein n=1 Tax=Citrus sinensis TaxID=2711 RepID=A0A067D640_CITSI|nr:hypothetical protein CISIN_1g047098mg [Citrus sinensis]
MPKVKTNRVQNPEGWELIKPTLRELQAKMREGGLRAAMFLTRTMELYEFCLDQGYKSQIWRKKEKVASCKMNRVLEAVAVMFDIDRMMLRIPGYERLCCLRCMQPHDHNFQMT